MLIWYHGDLSAFGIWSLIQTHLSQTWCLGLNLPPTYLQQLLWFGGQFGPRPKFGVHFGPGPNFGSTFWACLNIWEHFEDPGLICGPGPNLEPGRKKNATEKTRNPASSIPTGAIRYKLCQKVFWAKPRQARLELQEFLKFQRN